MSRHRGLKHLLDEEEFDDEDAEAEEIIAEVTRLLGKSLNRKKVVYALDRNNWDPQAAAAFLTPKPKAPAQTNQPQTKQPQTRQPQTKQPQTKQPPTKQPEPKSAEVTRKHAEEEVKLDLNADYPEVFPPV